MANNISRTANVVFKIDGASQSRQEVERVRSAFENFGDEGKKSAQKVVDATDAIQRGVDRVEKKINQGKVVTVRDVSEMAVNFQRFEQTIKQTFGAVEKAPADIQRAWKLAGDQVKRVEQEVVRSNKAIEDQKNVTNQAGASWTGWGNAIDNVSPKLGKLVSQLGTVAAGFTAGWQAGQKLNDFIQTDTQVWDHWLSGFSQRLGAFIKGSSAMTVEFIGLLKNTVTGNFGEMQKSVTAIDAVGREMWAGVVDGATKSTDATKKQAAAIADLLEAQKKAREEFNLLNKALADGSITTEQYNGAILKLLPNLDEKTKKLNEAKIAEAERQKVVADSIKQIDDIIAALKREQTARQLGVDQLTAEIESRAAYKAALEENIAADERAKNVKNGLTNEMAAELAQILALLPEHDKHSEAIERFNKALQQDINLHATGLAPEQEKQLRALAEQIAKYETLNPLQRQDVESQIARTLEMARGAEAASKAKIVYDELTKTFTNVKEAGDGFSASQSAIAEAFKDTTGPSSYATELQRVNTEIAALATNMKGTMEIMREFNRLLGESAKAAADAAGDDFIGPVKP